MNNEIDEIVEKILGLDVKVKTNKCEERIIRLTNFENNKDSTIAFNRSNFKNDPKRQIVIAINCDDYSCEVI